MSQCLSVPQRTCSTAGPALCHHSETALRTAQGNVAGTSSVADGTGFQPATDNQPTNQLQVMPTEVLQAKQPYIISNTDFLC